jgi:hypothetical protein
MAAENKPLKRASGNIVGPNYYNKAKDEYEIVEGSNGSINMQLAGSNLAEQKTQADAVGGTLTFAEGIKAIEIYNRDTVNDGVFNVNGINITVPKGEPVEFQVAGTPRATVTVTGSTSYIVSRLI